uniref:Thioredoxin-like_fold domain-containing protein n=1 Tax=Toxocara canis TaxID=6265 RepID=A0A183UVK6_TOXCA
LLVCIQGLRDLREAFDRCISRLSPQTQQKLIECSTSQSGEILNYQSMLMTHRAGIRIWPTMFVNGQFFDRSYPAEIEICRHTAWC